MCLFNINNGNSSCLWKCIITFIWDYKPREHFNKIFLINLFHFTNNILKKSSWISMNYMFIDLSKAQKAVSIKKGKLNDRISLINKLQRIHNLLNLYFWEFKII